MSGGLHQAAETVDGIVKCISSQFKVITELNQAIGSIGKQPLPQIKETKTQLLSSAAFPSVSPVNAAHVTTICLQATCVRLILLVSG